MKITHISKIFFTILGIFAFTIISCNDEDDSPSQESLLTQERKEILTNVFENNITISLNTIQNDLNDLENSVNSFSNEKTEENLVNIQNQWKKSIADWKQMQVYNISQIGTTFLYYNIHFPPANKDLIEEKINGTETIDNAFIKSLGSYIIGFTGIEYLIFNKNNVDLLNDFTIAENADRRILYLKEVVLELKNTFATIKEKWLAYQNDFIQNNDTGVTSMQGQLINNIITTLEVIKITKLEKPFQGLAETEAFYSDYSKEIILKELEATQQLFNGNFSSGNQKGFDDYLIVLNESDLVSEINEKFEACKTAANEISSLNSAIENGDTKVNTLIQKIKDLLLVVKIDMAAATKTTVTFNDTDGD
ncbi:imelysin family protein [Aureivirga marina]|uniref:imelysin family protein n=1 Tax=Aureivirga marina TaxID=1182451 RepID=UPI0018CB847D|nr:imelysin family protein [Aureivirga marina]